MAYPVIRQASLSVLAAVLCLSCATPGIAATPKVDASVKRAVKWLYSQQKAGGYWEHDPRRNPNADTHLFFGDLQGPTHGGWTALVTFALLEAGEKATDERMIRAIAWLRAADLRSVYSISLRCMVFAKLPQTPENRAMLEADSARLLQSLIRTGPGKNMWDYEIAAGNGKRESEWGPVDHSISQFGVLGLWACVQAGINVPQTHWRDFEQAWRSHQYTDGGWGYNSEGRPGAGGRDPTPGITAAGVATLLIIQDIIGATPPAPVGTAVPAGVAATSDIAIVRGLTWLDRNFDKIAAEGAYSWYAVERIATAGGHRYIGRHDWYDKGVRKLIATQEADGHWEFPTTGIAGTAIAETAFAVLFMVHGRAPVLISKLNYSAGVSGISRDQSWNQRPRDVANLVRYTASAAEQPYNWQVVNFSAPASEMGEVPVMFVSGMRPMTLLEREREKLKGYIESGGMLLASSEAAPIGGEAGTDAFSRSVVDLAAKLFPQYKFRELPLDHPIFTDQQFRPKQWKERPVVWGLSNGVRELMVLLPIGDHGRTWNFNGVKSDPMKFEIGADILQYAVSREPPPSKGESHIIRPRFLMEVAASQPASQPATGTVDILPPELSGVPATAPADQILQIPAGAKRIVVGRLTVGENWDPEPGAWRRLATLIANDFNLFAEVRNVDAAAASLAGVKVLHWTGTTAVKLTDPQRQAIDGFVKAGGTLVVDAAGGSPAFADSAAAELKAIFKTQGDVVGTVLAEDDPVYRLREARIEKFEYRRYLSSRVTGKLNAPRVQGIDRAGRTTVYFSREDLTGGCVGQNTDGISGYRPATATAIMRNIVLSAAKR